MTPQEVGARLVAVLEADPAAAEGAPVAVASVSGGEQYARATVDVPVAAWVEAAHAARDDAELSCNFFDWLSAVDEDDEFAVVAHLWSTHHRHGVLLRTRVPKAAAAVPSIVPVYAGAAWHERETHEMFGIDFPDHPGGLRPLLLPPEFEGHPLRKEFVLASRVAKAWPGAKEPGESESGAARRAPMRPPGVPDPTEWGPSATPSEAPSATPSEPPAAAPTATSAAAPAAAPGEPPGRPAGGAAPGGEDA